MGSFPGHGDVPLPWDIIPNSLLVYVLWAELRLLWLQEQQVIQDWVIGESHFFFFFFFGCAAWLVGSYFPDQGLSPRPLQWVLTTGPPGKSHHISFSIEIWFRTKAKVIFFPIRANSRPFVSLVESFSQPWVQIWEAVSTELLTGILPTWRKPLWKGSNTEESGGNIQTDACPADNAYWIEPFWFCITRAYISHLLR